MKKEDVKRAIAYSGNTVTGVSRALGTSQHNLSAKLAREPRPQDMRDIARAIGAEFVEGFLFPDGTFVTSQPEKGSDLLPDD